MGEKNYWEKNSECRLTFFSHWFPRKQCQRLNMTKLVWFGGGYEFTANLPGIKEEAAGSITRVEFCKKKLLVLCTYNPYKVWSSTAYLLALKHQNEEKVKEKWYPFINSSLNSLKIFSIDFCIYFCNLRQRSSAWLDRWLVLLEKGKLQLNIQRASVLKWAKSTCSGSPKENSRCRTRWRQRGD